MLSRMLGRVLIAVVVLTTAALVPMCLWQRQRAISQVEAVSVRFVKAASELDLVALRSCITEEGRASMPALYTRIVDSKLRALNRYVRIDTRLSVTDVKMRAGEARVRIKREVVERGTRLGKPVNTNIRDQCTVVCVFDGERWLVDLDRTLAEKNSPLANIALFRECRIK